MEGGYVFGGRFLGSWAREGHAVGLEVEVVGRGCCCCCSSGDYLAGHWGPRLGFIAGVEAVLVALADDDERDLRSRLRAASLVPGLFDGSRSIIEDILVFRIRDAGTVDDDI